MENDMNVAEATEVFDVTPSDKACADLLRAALQAETDGQLSRLGLHRIVGRVAEWLADE